MKSAKKKVVCFGGGTGMSSLLGSLRHNPLFEVTAIVTMFDSGNSSGELRDRFGILPPGDIMKCMVALAQYPDVVREMLNKRVVRPGMAPHSMGNLLLFGIEKVYGDYYEAVKVFSELLSISGTVIPVATTSTTLCAESMNGKVFEGENKVASQYGAESAIKGRTPIKRIFLNPQVSGFAEAIKAIRSADIFIVGPGNLYSSVLPNFLPTGISEAMAQSTAPIVYVMNLLTDGRAMSQKEPLTHWVAIAESYVGRSFSRIIVNRIKPPAAISNAYRKEGKYPLLWTPAIKDKRFIPADVWCEPTIARHDPAALTWAITYAATQLIK